MIYPLQHANKRDSLLILTITVTVSSCSSTPTVDEMNAFRVNEYNKCMAMENPSLPLSMDFGGIFGSRKLDKTKVCKLRVDHEFEKYARKKGLTNY